MTGAALEKKIFERPKKAQLTNFLSYYKRTTRGGARWSDHEFLEWCNQRSAIPPETEPDRVFVLAYGTELDEQRNAKIKMFATSRRLLGIALKSNRIRIEFLEVFFLIYAKSVFM